MIRGPYAAIRARAEFDGDRTPPPARYVRWWLWRWAEALSADAWAHLSNAAVVADDLCGVCSEHRLVIQHAHELDPTSAETTW